MVRRPRPPRDPLLGAAPGVAEAVVLGAMGTAAHPGLDDPNARLGDAFLAMVDTLRCTILGSGAPKTLGLVYTKVAKVSDTHTAEKLVRPVAARGR